MENPLFLLCVFRHVRLIGLEPTRIATPDPKSGASTNFATSAFWDSTPKVCQCVYKACSITDKGSQP